MITETEAFGTAKADEMSLANQLNRKIPISLPLGPPHVMVLKTYGSNNSLYFLTSKEGSCQTVLIRSGKVILGKNYVETRRKQKMARFTWDGESEENRGRFCRMGSGSKRFTVLFWITMKRQDDILRMNRQTKSAFWCIPRKTAFSIRSTTMWICQIILNLQNTVLRLPHQPNWRTSQ